MNHPQLAFAARSAPSPPIGNTQLHRNAHEVPFPFCGSHTLLYMR